jgi:TPR repeat protein
VQKKIEASIAAKSAAKEAEVKAFQGYKVKAEKGDPIAQYDLGNSYYGGNGVVQDYVQAVSWYRKAIAQGHLKAHSDLGLCYFNGTGVKKNEVEAVSWYRKAADQGDTLALHNLGGCYGSGSGVEKDEVEAYALWYLASITDEVTRKALAEIEKNFQTMSSSLEKRALSSSRKRLTPR